MTRKPRQLMLWGGQYKNKTFVPNNTLDCPAHPGRPQRKRGMCNACYQKTLRKEGWKYKETARRNYHSRLGVPETRPSACEICKKQVPLVVDHCHRKMVFRGFLCNNCNTALGMVYDNPTILASMIDYLTKFNS